MTANEMASAVRVGAERVASNGARGYDDARMSILLTKAEWHETLEKLDWKNNKKREGFEETEIRQQGLSQLIKDYVAGPSNFQTGTLSKGLYKGKFFDLPEDFMLTIMEECTTNVDDCILKNGSKVIADVDTISHNEITKQRKNVYKRPYLSNNEAMVWRLTYSREFNVNNPTPTAKRHEIITDSTFDIIEYHLRYLKIPSGITVNEIDPTLQVHCELDEITHESIVQKAIDIIREDSDRQKIQHIENISNIN